MGIPGFYSWLLQTYPDIKRSVLEHSISNLYLDLNQIINICAEYNNEDQIIESVLDRIDQICSSVFPRQLLYIAMDGVAPRARINHQRTKRFIESKNIADKAMKNKTTDNKEEASSENIFDTCNIKPGTKFMSKLSKSLQNYICDRINTNSNWKQILVILSDTNVPGEGEQKIINFIREQHQQLHNNQNTHHVVYSGDSDLVLLGLATHQNNLIILLETCGRCKKIGHQTRHCRTQPIEAQVNDIQNEFMYINLTILRQRLREKLNRKGDRAIDDWIFICLLFGNDFLPPLVSIDEPRHNMDKLLQAYTNHMTVWKKHLTKNGKVKLKYLERFFTSIGREERSMLIEQHERYKKDSGQNADLNDNIRLSESGGRERYYQKKFNVTQDGFEDFSRKITEDYTRTLCWIFEYYHNGVPSWNW